MTNEDVEEREGLAAKVGYLETLVWLLLNSGYLQDQDGRLRPALSMIAAGLTPDLRFPAGPQWYAHQNRASPSDLGLVMADPLHPSRLDYRSELSSLISLLSQLQFEHADAIEGLQRQAAEAAADAKAARRRFAQTLAALSRASDLRKARFPRALPAAIYLSDASPEDGEVFFRTFSEVADALGFETLYDEPAVIGSWFKRLVLGTREALTSDEVVSRLKKVEEGLELRHVEYVKAERDAKLAEALERTLKAVEGQTEAVIHLGSLLVIKKDGKVLSKSLTKEQQEMLDQNPDLIACVADLHMLFFSVGQTAPRPVYDIRGVPRPSALKGPAAMLGHDGPTGELDDGPLSD